MSCQRLYLAAAVAATSIPVFAAETVPPLGETMVTATRTETPVSDVLAPVILINRDDLARSLAPDISALLQFHAGIDIARNGGPGQTTSVFIRGTDSNHATVLVDGVRINPGTIGGAQIQNVSPDVVDRIEIVKGPRSTLYGTDAIGGVINIITRRYPTSGFDASVGYGRYDTREASFSAGFRGDQQRDRALPVYGWTPKGFLLNPSAASTADTRTRAFRCVAGCRSDLRSSARASGIRKVRPSTWISFSRP